MNQRRQQARAEHPGPNLVIGRIGRVEQPRLEFDDRAIEIVDALDRKRRIGRPVIALQFEAVARIAVEQVVATRLAERIGLVAEIEGLDERSQLTAARPRTAQLGRIGQRHADGGNRKVRSIMVEQAIVEPLPAADLEILRGHLEEPRRQYRTHRTRRAEQVAQPLDCFVDLIQPQHVLDRMPKIVLDHSVDGDDVHPVCSESAARHLSTTMVDLPLHPSRPG